METQKTTIKRRLIRNEDKHIVCELVIRDGQHLLVVIKNHQCYTLIDVGPCSSVNIQNRKKGDGIDDVLM